MKKYTTAIILTFTALFITSCSSQDDEFIEKKTNNAITCSKTRSDFNGMNFYAYITYHPSITCYAGFISFQNIKIWPYSEDDTVETLQRYGAIPESNTYDIYGTEPSFISNHYPDNYLIRGEFMSMSVSIAVNPYINFGNYRISLYDMSENIYDCEVDNPILLGSLVTYGAQAGNYHSFEDLTLSCNSEGQTEYYLKLYVEPID